MKIAPFIALCFILTSCAASISGPTQIVTVKVSPPTATIRIDSMPLGSYAKSAEVLQDTMIAAFELARDERHVIEISNPGHKSIRVITGMKDNPWVWGDMNPMLYPYTLIDACSAARYSIVPAALSVALPEGEGSVVDAEYPARGGYLGWVIWGVTTSFFVIMFTEMAEHPILGGWR